MPGLVSVSQDAKISHASILLLERVEPSRKSCVIRDAMNLMCDS